MSREVLTGSVDTYELEVERQGDEGLARPQDWFNAKTYKIACLMALGDDLIF